MPDTSVSHAAWMGMAPSAMRVVAENKTNRPHLPVSWSHEPLEKAELHLMNRNVPDRMVATWIPMSFNLCYAASCNRQHKNY